MKEQKMTTNLAKQKENLEAYIRSTGYNTRGMNVENNHVLIEKPILDSYEDEHQRKELVDLVNVIETRTRGGKYEVTDFESDSLQEVSENSVERTEADKKKTISVDYLVKLFSGKLDFSQEQLDDGQYNLTDFLGKKIIKLKRRTRNREIGKILQTAKVQTATSLDDLKSIVSLINPERNVSMVVSQSLFIYDAASGVYTLRLMTIVALFLLPFVLGYQVWSYSIFRKRLTKEDKLEY